MPLFTMGLRFSFISSSSRTSLVVRLNILPYGTHAVTQHKLVRGNYFSMVGTFNYIAVVTNH